MPGVNNSPLARSTVISAIGTWRKSQTPPRMSAFEGKADSAETFGNVR